MHSNHSSVVTRANQAISNLSFAVRGVAVFGSRVVKPRLFHQFLNAGLQFVHALIHIYQSTFNISSDTVKFRLLFFIIFLKRRMSADFCLNERWIDS